MVITDMNQKVNHAELRKSLGKIYYNGSNIPTNEMYLTQIVVRDLEIENLNRTNEMNHNTWQMDQATIQEQEHQIKQLQEELASTNSAWEVDKNRIQQLEVRCANQMLSLERREMDNNRLEKQNVELAAKNERQYTTIVSNASELVRLHKIIDEQGATIEKHNATIKKHSEEVEFIKHIAEEGATRLREENNELRKQVDQLQLEGSDIPALRKACADAHDNIVAKARNIHYLEQQNNALRESNDYLSVAHSKLQDVVIELNDAKIAKLENRVNKLLISAKLKMVRVGHHTPLLGLRLGPRLTTMRDELLHVVLPVTLFATEEDRSLGWWWEPARVDALLRRNVWVTLIHEGDEIRNALDLSHKLVELVVV